MMSHQVNCCGKFILNAIHRSYDVCSLSFDPGFLFAQEKANIYRIELSKQFNYEQANKYFVHEQLTFLKSDAEWWVGMRRQLSCLVGNTNLMSGLEATGQGGQDVTCLVCTIVMLVTQESVTKEHILFIYEWHTI